MEPTNCPAPNSSHQCYLVSFITAGCGFSYVDSDILAENGVGGVEGETEKERREGGRGKDGKGKGRERDRRRVRS